MKRVALLGYALIIVTVAQSIEARSWATKMAHAPTIDDPKVKAQDSEGHIPYIKLFTPIFYLHKDEPDYPIAVEEYFTADGTSLDAVIEHKGKKKFPVYVPKGQVTMEKIYELYEKSRPEYEGADKITLPKHLHVNASAGSLHGLNPALHKNKAGDLNVPIYVATWTNNENNSIFLQYVTFYGENYGYGTFQFGYHTADLEHVTIELNKKLLTSFVKEYKNSSYKAVIDRVGLSQALGDKNPITRIYYGAHGDKDGYWMPGNHSHIHYEGTHPVVYVAKGGHGNYPRVGTYVRLGGTANDETKKNIRWVPEVIRIYPNTDPRFNAATMGWVYAPFNLGWKSDSSVEAKGSRSKPAIGALWKKTWFMQEDQGMPSYNAYDSRRFCSPGGHHAKCLIENGAKSINTGIFSDY